MKEKGFGREMEDSNIESDREVDKGDFHKESLENSSDENPYKRVTVQSLEFDWIFEKGNARTFLEILNKNSHDDLLSQFSIKIFVDLMWNEMYRQILFQCGIFIIYLGLFVSLASTRQGSYFYNLKIQKVVNGTLTLEVAFHEKNEDVVEIAPTVEQMNTAWWLELIHLIVIIPFIAFFTRREYMEHYNSLKATASANLYNPIVLLKNILVHFLDQIFTQNGIDLASIILNLIYLGNLFFFNIKHLEFVEEDFRQWLTTIGAYACFFMWIKVLYWFKLFELTQYYVTQIVETIKEILGFMTLYIIAIFAFANFFYIIQFNVPKGAKNNYVEEHVKMTVVDSVISMYMLSLGEFAMEGYNEGFNNYSAWLMFFLATWVLMLIMLNFIITTMGEPFARV